MKSFFHPKGVRGSIAAGAALLFLAVAFFSTAAQGAAKDYPNKAINLIVPWSGGAATKS